MDYIDETTEDDVQEGSESAFEYLEKENEKCGTGEEDNVEFSRTSIVSTPSIETETLNHGDRVEM